MTPHKKLLNTAEMETAMNVFTTRELSFLETEPLGPQRADILTLFAFFDSENISEELFRPFFRDSLKTWKDMNYGEVQTLSLIPIVNRRATRLLKH
jgi:hypothetical protein